MADKKFIVMVDDNFHFMDEDSRYCLGEFDNEAEALAAARQVVDRFLLENYKSGMTAEELWEGYANFGEDPWISNHSFSAWEYARKRCLVICTKGKSPGVFKY
jgi:hypothetical protein